MHEGILCRIGRLVRVPQQAPGEAVAGRLVVLDQLGEGSPIPRRRPCDDGLFLRKRGGAACRGVRVAWEHRLPIITLPSAGVAESADASVSNTDERKLV